MAPLLSFEKSIMVGRVLAYDDDVGSAGRRRRRSFELLRLEAPVLLDRVSHQPILRRTRIRNESDRPRNRMGPLVQTVVYRTMAQRVRESVRSSAGDSTATKKVQQPARFPHIRVHREVS